MRRPIAGATSVHLKLVRYQFAMPMIMNKWAVLVNSFLRLPVQFQVSLLTLGGFSKRTTVSHRVNNCTKNHASLFLSIILPSITLVISMLSVSVQNTFLADFQFKSLLLQLVKEWNVFIPLCSNCS